MSNSFLFPFPSLRLLLQKNINMKQKLILLLSILCLALTAQAQDSTSVDLQEVEVKASKITIKADGQLIVPSDIQKQSSTNGYSLLGKLGLPAIRIDDVAHTIIALGQQGAVQLRLNGALASKEDLLALDPKTVKNIDFIDKPGVRYGKNIACVINISTRSSKRGYTLGADLHQALTTRIGDDAVYATMNHGASQWGLTYDFNYQNFKGTQYEEEADYLLNDGTHRLMSRKDRLNHNRNHGHDLQLKYTLNDSNTVFQATLSTGWDYTPVYQREINVVDGPQNYLSTSLSHDRSFNPILDIYYFRQLGKHQSITANAVGTNISTNTYNYDDEQSVYQYDVDGNTWSLISEAIYENQLRPLTFSTGMRSQLKYTRNEYQGDVNALNRMHSSSLYLFGEAKGKWRKMGYVAGLGVSREYYRQANYHYDFWLFRPKFTLTYAPSTPWMLSYSYEMSQHISQVAMISDAKIRQNSMEWTVGNPEITPNRVIEHQLRLSYNRPRFMTQCTASARWHPHCNMAHYERMPDNQFYNSQTIQRGIEMFYVTNYTRWDIIADKLTVSTNGGIYRFINRGDDYTHLLTTYNIGGSLQAYLGRWTIMAYADNGWKFMEGETWNQRGASTMLRCSYRRGQYTVSLSWHQPFQSNPSQNYAELVNANIKKRMSLRSTDYGNRISLSLSWRLNRGHSYDEQEKRLQNKDTQTGILK